MNFQPDPLEQYPGFHIRRLQQIAVAVFMEETQDLGITPVQWAALAAVLREPGVDQRTLARLIGFDTSTIGSVIDRLQARGLMLRSDSPSDRRVRLLHATDAGRTLMQTAEGAVQQAQARILAPLPAKQRQQFMKMLEILIAANDGCARAPRDISGQKTE